LTDPLHSPKAKIERAQELTGELSREITAFFGQPDLCRLDTEDLNPQSGDRWVKIVLARPVPDRIPQLIAEVVYHLRSSLDQLAVALAHANGQTSDGAYFPFAGDINDFESKGTQSKIKKIAPKAARIIRELQPYRGGNDQLWGLGALANVDKHNIAFPVGSLATATPFQHLSISNARVGIRIPPANSRLDGGIPFCNLGPEGTLTRGGAGPNIGLRIGGMVFGNVAVFQGSSVVETLDQLRQLVAGIIEQFEDLMPTP
jgi:hypothetical protein